MPTETKKLRSCREALAWLGQGNNPALTTEQAADCHRLAKFMDSHPVMGLVLQQIILHRYYAAHDEADIRGTVDWSAILEWMIANLPTLLQILLTFLPLFASDNTDDQK